MGTQGFEPRFRLGVETYPDQPVSTMIIHRLTPQRSMSGAGYATRLYYIPIRLNAFEFL